MLGLNWTAARYTWTAAMVLLALCLVYLLRNTLFVFALALLFAYLLSPLVDLLDRAIPRKGTRTLALTLAYLIFVGAVVITAVQIGSGVGRPGGSSQFKLPEMLSKFEEPSPVLPGVVNDMKARMVYGLRNE